jgi:Pyruvate/2-oxoacid:ferredoxin oxidoreductase delta subunit
VPAKRKIISIDESKCNGCGQCADACAEGAIKIVDGKAKLTREDYCDGLGACLGECPQGALTIEEREAAPFDEGAVTKHSTAKRTPHPGASARAVPCAVAGAGQPASVKPSCPGSAMRAFTPAAPADESPAPPGQPPPSQLGHWPVQLRLLHPAAPFLKNADLILCADCVPFAVPDLHRRYLTGRAVAVSCPKLDDIGETVERLAAIFREARPRKVTVLRMEVPCCGGLVMAAHKAREAAGTDVPIEVHIIGVHGGVRPETALL